MRAHVTGGSGFLGGHVIPLLVARGHDVSALARSRTAAARVERLGATAVPGDLDEPASIDAAFAASEAEVLVNLASLGFGHAPTIVAAAEEAGLRRAVFVSTTSIFTMLDTASKPVRRAAEDTVRASTLDWTILRPGRLTDKPGIGRVRLAGHTGRGAVPRDDVAAVLLALLDTRVARMTLELVSGDTPVDEAVRALASA